jgi:hypothetical protein
MKVERRNGEIELSAETPFEREALAALLRYREITIKPGRSSDDNWPPDPLMTNVVICLPDPDDWRL